MSILASRYQIKLKIIGASGQADLYDTFGDIPGLEIDFVDEIPRDEPDAVRSALADIDIGLYPLIERDWNRCKCEFKALEFMALKFPVVSSDIPENSVIIEDGVEGFLVNGVPEWVSRTSELIEDSKKRKKMGLSGRGKVLEHYNVVISVGRLLSALNHVR